MQRAFGHGAGRANHGPEALRRAFNLWSCKANMRNSSLEKMENSVPIALVPPQPREYFVDAIEAGKFLKLHWRTIQRLAREGIIPAHPFGSGPRKTWRFLLSELDAWMRSQVNSACRP